MMILFFVGMLVATLFGVFWNLTVLPKTLAVQGWGKVRDLAVSFDVTDEAICIMLIERMPNGQRLIRGLQRGKGSGVWQITTCVPFEDTPK